MINTYDFIVSRPDYFKKITVKNALILFYKCPQVDLQLKIYNHYNQITFTVSGEKKFHHRNKTWHMTSEKAIFLRRTAYDQEMVYDTEWEVVSIYFSDDFLRQVFNECRTLFMRATPANAPREMILDLHVDETTRAFFYGLIPYFTQSVSPPEKLLELKFRELIVNLLSNKSNSTFLEYVNSVCDQNRPLLQEIMEANFMYNLSLDEYARIAQLSLSSFKRKFLEVFQSTPGKWLRKKRLDYSRYFLHQSNKNVTEIAYESGFDNVTHFSKVFKQEYGLSPLQYRKMRHSPVANGL